MITQFASRKLTRVFAAHVGIFAAEMGTKAQKESAAQRDKLLAQLTLDQRSDLEIA